MRARWGWTRSRYECPESQAKITTAAGLSHRQDVIEGILSPAGGRKGSWYSFRYLPVAAFYKLTAWETRCLQGKPVLLEPGEWGFIPGSTTLERVTVPLVPSVSLSAKQGMSLHPVQNGAPHLLQGGHIRLVTPVPKAAKAAALPARP